MTSKGPASWRMSLNRRLDDDVRHVDFRRGAQHVHLAESLPVQRPDRAPQVAALTPDDVVAEVSVGTPGIACRTE